MLAGAAIRRAAPGSHGYFYYAVIIRPGNCRSEAAGAGCSALRLALFVAAVAAIEPLRQVVQGKIREFSAKIIFLPAIYQDACPKMGLIPRKTMRGKARARLKQINGAFQSHRSRWRAPRAAVSIG
jgi:hypothetical protein